MNLSGAPSALSPVDIKDPRLRVTPADVAMRFASDGPMYAVIVLVGVLAMKGTTTALESIVGAALALLARSHPPSSLSGVKLGGTIGAAVLVLFVLAALSSKPSRALFAGEVRSPSSVVVK